ncbi:MAG: hypothetical protein V4719_25660 [Planctomycetota bacterium]
MKNSHPLSGGAAQAAAKGSTVAKFGNAAFFIKDGIDAGQQGWQLLQSKSLTEALLNAGLLSIQIVGLKGSAGQVLDDGKSLCKNFDGQIKITLKPRRYSAASPEDLTKLDKNLDGIVDPSDFPKESLGSLDGHQVYQAPDGSLWACSVECRKLLSPRDGGGGGAPGTGGVPLKGILYDNPSALVTERVAELKAAIPDAQKGRVTMGVAVVEDASGTRSVLVSTSEPRGYLRPGVTLKPGETMVPGTGHAEVDIANYIKAKCLKLVDIGATKPVCGPCQDVLGPTGANISTPLKTRPQ